RRANGQTRRQATLSGRMMGSKIRHRNYEQQDLVCLNPMESQVRFKNADRKWLRGMIHAPAGRGPFRGVVFFHGFTADRMESHWMFVKCARALAQVGIACLRFDFFGSGESAGEFQEATLIGEIEDARCAVQYFRQRREVDGKRVGLLGLSLGGAVAATLAPRLKARALVLWSTIAHPMELQRLAALKAPLIPKGGGDRAYGAHRIPANFLGGLPQVDPLAGVHGFKRPTLIIHPEKDEYLPVHHAENLFNNSGAKFREKIIISGADHVFTSIAWETAVIGHSVRWFKDYL
ncbi:MAG: alpha/beta hydrolase, partial [Terriglobia bacterium]